MRLNPYNLENIDAFNKAYDRIEYLARRVQEVRETLITDDWALSYYMNRWSNEV